MSIYWELKTINRLAVFKYVCLNACASDTSRAANEAWVSRQNLQDLYQRLLVMDLEYALDKKVEQDLWVTVFIFIMYKD